MTTSIATLHDELVSAIEDRDAARVLSVHRRMQAADPPPQQLLSEFQTAAEAGDYDKGKTLLNQLNARYAELQVEQRAAADRAALARDAGAVSAGDRSTVREHLQRSQSTALERLSFITEATAFLERPEDVGTERIVDAAATLTEYEDERDRTAEAAESVAETATLPPTVRIRDAVTDDPHPIDERFPVTVTVQNIGDDPATALELSVSGPDSVTAVDTPDTVDTLGGEATTTLSPAVSVDTAGEVGLTVSVTSDDAGGAQQTLTVAVTDDPDPTGGTPTPTPDGDAAAEASGLPDWVLAAGVGAAGTGVAGLAAYRYLFDTAADDET